MSFPPFSEFSATEEEMAEFRQLRDSDRASNLVRRFKHFAQQNLDGVKKYLAFVPLINKNGFTCGAVPGEGGILDLCYSIGWWYSFEFPELMLVGSPIARMQAAIQHIGESLPGLPGGSLQEKVQQMARLLKPALAAEGLQTNSLQAAPPAFLEEYPYGYGGFFYAHFLDDVSVPLLVSQVREVSR